MVLRRSDLGADAPDALDALDSLAARYGVRAVEVADGAPVPGSYWGAPEAGLARGRLYARRDTPLHSFLHELGHFVCMTPERRARLWRDAAGDEAEECAVCYLQVVLADWVPYFGRERCCDDMDAWGYSFREGSVRTWLGGDGADARAWLGAHGLVDAQERPTWRVRER